MKAAVIAVAVALLLVGGWLFAYVGFSGGIDSVIRNRKAAPDLSDLKEERARALTTLVSESKKAVEGSSFKYFAQGEDDTCYRGQNNFKVEEGYAHRCILEVVRYYGFDGDFRQQALRFHQSLARKGWTSPAYSDLRATITVSFDRYHGKPKEAGETFLVNDLPKPCYQAKDLQLCIRFAERQSSNFSELKYASTSLGGYEIDYRKTELVEIDTLFEQITADHRYLLAISMGTEYFEN